MQYFPYPSRTKVFYRLSCKQRRKNQFPSVQRKTEEDSFIETRAPGGHYYPAMLTPSCLSFLAGFTRDRNYPSNLSATVFSQRDSVHLVKTEFLDQDFGPAEILTHSVTEKPIAIAHRSPFLEEYWKQLSHTSLILARSPDFTMQNASIQRQVTHPLVIRFPFFWGYYPVQVHQI